MLTRFSLSIILLAFMALVQVQAVAAQEVDRTIFERQVFVELDIFFHSIYCSSRTIVWVPYPRQTSNYQYHEQYGATVRLPGTGVPPIPRPSSYLDQLTSPVPRRMQAIYQCAQRMHNVPPSLNPALNLFPSVMFCRYLSLQRNCRGQSLILHQL